MSRLDRLVDQGPLVLLVVLALLSIAARAAILLG